METVKHGKRVRGITNAIDKIEEKVSVAVPKEI